MTDRPMSKRMQDVLAVIADAKNGEISGWSIATWLLQRQHPECVRESLRGLVNRGLITMRPMDDPNDDFRKAFPDRMKAMYSVVKPQEEDIALIALNNSIARGDQEILDSFKEKS